MLIMTIARQILIVLSLLISLLFSSLSLASDLKINYVISRTTDDMFYGPVVRFMQSAANDLGVELNIIEAEDDHTTVDDKVRSDLELSSAADAVIVVSVKESGASILKVCQEYGVPLMIENSAILDQTVGQPREFFSTYIGEMLPDDEMAGYKLAKYLIEISPRASDGKVYLVAISGPYGTSASIEREKGLKRAIAEHKDVVLLQIVRANWERQKAARVFSGLKKRYPHIRAVWTASDGMALGVADQVEAMGLMPGVDIVTGGIDWSLEGTHAVRDGKIQASAGGHFMEGAWALIAMYDYLNGQDFIEPDGVNMKTDMYLMTEHNYPDHAWLLQEENWPGIDFKSLSRYLNPQKNYYDFDMQAISRTMKR